MSVVRVDFERGRVLPVNTLADKCGQMAHHVRQVRAACDEIAAALDELRACTARFCDSISRLA